MSNQAANGEAQSRPARAMFGAKRRPEPGETSWPSPETVPQTEAQLPPILHSPPLDMAQGFSEQTLEDQRSDPAPSASAIAEQRAQQLVNNISSQMLGELRDLREQIDGLMREMN